MYDLNKDPDQLTNIQSTINPKILVVQNKRLVELSICVGVTCREEKKPWPPAHQYLGAIYRNQNPSTITTTKPNGTKKISFTAVKDTMLKYVKNLFGNMLSSDSNVDEKMDQSKHPARHLV